MVLGRITGKPIHKAKFKKLEPYMYSLPLRVEYSVEELRQILRLTGWPKILLRGLNYSLSGGPGRPSHEVQLIPYVRLTSERVHGHLGSSSPQLPLDPSLRQFSPFPESSCLLPESISRGYFYSTSTPRSVVFGIRIASSLLSSSLVTVVHEGEHRSTCRG
ncbi:unnamed protein product [Nezara viridula]|uniref:Uncharacterized protein n=1 Tax=Nezara viridula TaxID=85310 RepID=A0A9P0HD55_NEZVI|nr:unnamed protein product [Nezara viridula]